MFVVYSCSSPSCRQKKSPSKITYWDFPSSHISWRSDRDVLKTVPEYRNPLLGPRFILLCTGWLDTCRHYLLWNYYSWYCHCPWAHCSPNFTSPLFAQYVLQNPSYKESKTTQTWDSPHAGFCFDHRDQRSRNAVIILLILATLAKQNEYSNYWYPKWHFPESCCEIRDCIVDVWQISCHAAHWKSYMWLSNK